MLLSFRILQLLISNLLTIKRLIIKINTFAFFGPPNSPLINLRKSSTDMISLVFPNSNPLINATNSLFESVRPSYKSLFYFKFTLFGIGVENGIPEKQ